MSYEPTDADMALLYRAIGFKIESKYDGILVESDDSGELYLKVMSDGGHQDTVVGIALQAYLTERGVTFTSSRPRSLTMQATDFERLFSDISLVPDAPHVQAKTHEHGVENWMSRAGPDLNDSKEATRHEECMAAEIAELRLKLAEAQKHIASFSDIESTINMAAAGVWAGEDFTVTITGEQFTAFNS